MRALQTKDNFTLLALRLGAAIPIIYFGTQFVAALFYPGYSFLSQTTSELGNTRAIDASQPWIFNAGAVFTGFSLLIVACGFWLALRCLGTNILLATLTSLAIASVGMSNLCGVFFPFWSQVGRSPAHPVYLLVGFFLLPFLVLISLWSHRGSWLLRVCFAATLACFIGMIVIPCEIMGIDALRSMGLVERLLEADVFLPIGAGAFVLSQTLIADPQPGKSRFATSIAALALLLICGFAIRGMITEQALFATNKKLDHGVVDISASLEPIRAKVQLPALAGAVVGPQGLIAIGATGVRKVGDDTPVTLADKWRIFSDTKAMTAVLIGMFVDAGQISWDAKIPTLFPDVANIHPQFADVTLAQLLSHRSGIGEDSLEQMLAGKDQDYPQAAPLFRPNTMSTPAQRQALAAVVIQHAPIYKPGSEFRYSNWNYIVAASIVERLSGQSWEDLIRSRIFTPLGMTSGGFGVPASAGLVDQPWDHAARTPLAPGPANPQVDIPQILGPSSTVHCSLEDWGKFVALFLNGGRRDLISQASIDRITTAASSNGYAFGWFRQQRKWVTGDALRHNGTNGYVFASALVAPEMDRVYLIVTNTFQMTPDANIAEPLDQTLTKMTKSFPGADAQPRAKFKSDARSHR